MNIEEANEFHHLWDGSEDWVLLKVEHNVMAIIIHFATPEPTLSEIIAVRRLLTEYQSLPPTQVRALIGSSGKIEIEPLPSTEGVCLIEDDALAAQVCRQMLHAGVPVIQSATG